MILRHLRGSTLNYERQKEGKTAKTLIVAFVIYKFH